MTVQNNQKENERKIKHMGAETPDSKRRSVFSALLTTAVFVGLVILLVGKK